jgi:hypothetical protein
MLLHIYFVLCGLCLSSLCIQNSFKASKNSVFRNNQGKMNVLLSVLLACWLCLQHCAAWSPAAGLVSTSTAQRDGPAAKQQCHFLFSLSWLVDSRAPLLDADEMALHASD